MSKGVLAIVANVVLLGGLAWIARILSGAGNGDERAFALTLLLAATGGMLGWLLGFLASPYTATEGQRFSALARTAWAFVGGFLLSKLDPALNRLLSGDTLMDPLQGGRALIFLVVLIAAALDAYMVRSYLHRPKTGA
jgi:hypothetical protein